MLVIFSSSTYFILVVAVAADVVAVVVVLFALSSMPSIFSAIFTPKLLRFRFFFLLSSLTVATPASSWQNLKAGRNGLGAGSGSGLSSGLGTHRKRR